jgi:hypothetical protein
MNTQIHKPEWQRIEIWMLFAAIVAIVLFFLAPRTSDFEHVVTVESAGSSSPVDPVPRADALPFGAADVVQYFSTRLETKAAQGSGGAAVFENQHAATAADHWRVSVTTEEKSVAVDFAGGGDLGLGLAREFFDSPIFERTEGEKLHAMLARAPVDSVTRMLRFTASLTFHQVDGQQILSLRFLPNAVR